MVKAGERAEAAPEGAIDTDQDRYPTLTQALARINSEIAAGGVVVDRLEITCLANGEVNCKWWEPRAEEATFVFIPSPEAR